MSDDHPPHPFFQTFQRFTRCVNTHVSNFLARPQKRPSSTDDLVFSVASASSSSSASSTKVHPSNVDVSLVQPIDIINKQKAAPVSKEELGRATWTFLHTLAAQYPEHPTRQQKKDVKELMAILSRMYPCKECADHFKDVLRSNPVQVGSQAELSRWMCHVHNVVNRSLGKPVFVCERVDARWGKLDCEQRMCDLEGTTAPFGRD
ncbi:FAD-linked sulfhydryl oxidase ERV1 [Linum grandiflorum]